VPDVVDASPLALEILLLEWEDHCNSIGHRRELCGPPCLPRPDLRGDVVENRNPGLIGASGHTEIQPRVVYRDHQIHSLLVYRLEKSTLKPIEEAEPFHDLYESHHREVIELGEERDPLCRHQAPPRSQQPGCWKPLAERTRNPRSVQVARGLARQDQDDRGGHRGGLRGRNSELHGNVRDHPDHEDQQEEKRAWRAPLLRIDPLSLSVTANAYQ
jgi:hypothetical protein